jgi:hypothetical protein
MAGKGNTQTNPDNGGPNDEANAAALAEVEHIIDAKVETLRPSQRAFREMLTGLENIASEDTGTKGFAGDDIARILMADDEETMWDADELPGYNAKVLSGCDLKLFGIEVKFSTDPDITTILIGPKTRRKMYVLVHAARLNSNALAGTPYRLPDVGEEIIFNTSARYIVAKLFWLATRGRFDNGGTVPVTIHGTPLGGGKSVEKLKPLGAPIMAGTSEPPF